MTATLTYRQRLRRVLYFFPLQLFLLHVKKNHMLLLAWLILFGYATESIGVKYGIPYLFLYPEYFGKVNFFSYALTGFALGGFITAFNLYSYAMHGYRFPFIATLARPFLKFNVNNATIPALYILTFLWCSARFQYTKELVPAQQVVVNLLGFVSGIGAFLGLALLYFTSTNTDINKLLGRQADEYRPTEPLMDIIGPQHDAPPVGGKEKRQASRWLRRAQRTEHWRVDTYLTPRLQIKLARSSEHYDKELLRDVLWQNHINGSIFEVVLVMSFILLGAFSDLRLFAIPASASTILFFTMLLMIISALFSWLHGWTGTVIIGAILMVNALSHRTDALFYDNHPVGLDHTMEPAPYDLNTINALARDREAIRRDSLAFITTLEQWKKDNQALTGQDVPPKLVLIHCSGGGLRALLWSFRCLQYTDSLLDGTLMDRTALITGSSGGLIGASYFRQLYLNEQDGGGMDRFAPELLSELSSDMLNPVAFSFVTNDMFIRYRKVRDEERSYTLDRGHAFEKRLNQNTRGLLDVRLSALSEAEREARIPLLVISPVSNNDGRRLIIASNPSAYLTRIDPALPVHNDGHAESIEFGRLFAAQGASRLKLSSALRMNATFPYITPIVTLPSEPPMRVMDAGARDNYGYRVSLAFLFTFRKWIEDNTGGVVVLQLRDTQKELDVKPNSASLIGRLFDPVGSLYDNVIRIQDQDYDLMLQQASGWCMFPLDVIDIELRHDEEEQISLSWHLTAVERGRVLRSIGAERNQAAFQRFMEQVTGPKGPS